MKLLLTSVSISPLKELTSIPYAELRLIYIPTAADPYDGKEKYKAKYDFSAQHL